jgi:hypothetical protein
VIYVVDRIEGGRAVLMADDGRVFEVERQSLPAGCVEGSVLRAGDPPDWATATLDEPERQRRLQGARERLRDMAATDPGGDIDL